MSETPCNSGTAHFDVFTADSSGSYTVEQSHFEIQTQFNAVCVEPGECSEYTTRAMSAHAGAGVNDLKTHVAMTSAAAANGCATPDGGAGTVTVVD